MKAAVQYLFEPLLSKYFLIDSLFGRFLSEDDKNGIFRELCCVFRIPYDCETARIFNTANEEPFRDIKDASNYAKFCRLTEFASLDGQDLKISEDERIILDQKREAVTVKAEILSDFDRNVTMQTLYKTLLGSAMNGDIRAMTALGFMEYHGICVTKDRENALKRIRLSAKWNDLFGNLMGLAYDKENDRKYYDTLFTILSGELRKDTFAYINESKGGGAAYGVDRIAKLIERCFGHGVIRREVYDHGFADIAFTEFISVQDKEKLLINKKNDATAQMSGIPLGTIKAGSFVFDPSCAENFPLERKDELDRVIQNLTLAAEYPDGVYKPLMIISRDEHITEIYADMIRSGIPGGAVAVLDAETLTPRDFEGSKDNIFIRTVSETKTGATLFVIKNCEAADEACTDELLKMLDYDYRRKFKLFQLPISLDLSKIKFVLFGSAKNRLADKCDVVFSERLCDDEKERIIPNVISEKLNSYGRDDIAFSDECIHKLVKNDMSTVADMVNEAVRYAIFNNIAVVTPECIEKANKKAGDPGMESVFGYAGGKNAKN